MSRINFDTVLTGMDGEVIPSRPVKTDPTSGRPIEDVSLIPPLTLKQACATALIVAQQGDTDTEGLAYRLYTLAHQIRNGGEVELQADEVDLLKRRVERQYMPWIVGQVWDLLEGRDAPAAPLAAGPAAKPGKGRGRR